jgi:hypothetical protein
MGGYSVNTGKAWRWEFPKEFATLLTLKNNQLEFLASVTTIWLELLASSTPPLSCLLALGDNSSAIGWLHKANADETNNKMLHLISRKLATQLLNTDCCIYSQHFKGIYNEVADTLSRRHDLSDKDLLSFILSSFSEQVPSIFSIDPLPPSITFWMTWLLQKNKEHMEFNKKQETKKREHGADGKLTLKELKTSTTHSSSDSSPSCRPDSLEPLEQHSGKESFPEKIQNVWREAQSKRPWQNWARSSGQTWGSTPTMVQTAIASTPY